MKACLVDIQRASIHDGPGIRTVVFVKGCPLRCAWCDNPETQDFRQQLSFHESRCTQCGACEGVCPQGAHRVLAEGHEVDFKKCIVCGRCTDVCPSEALRLVGQDMTVEEILSVVLKDRVLYDQSGGGITVSGGEPLSQASFVARLFQRCHQQEIHTCLETSGYGSPQSLREVIPVTDLFLFDWKLSDRKAALRFLGGSISPIQRSFRTLMEHGCKVILRCPIVPRINDTSAHFDSIVRLIEQNPELVGVELLPYHDRGVSKSLHLGMQQRTFPTPSSEECAWWEDYFLGRGYPQVKLVW